jgi:hypothetical protein
MSKSNTRTAILLRLGVARHLTQSVRVGLLIEPFNPMLRYDV